MSMTSWEKPLTVLQEISAALVVTDNIHTIAHLMLDLAIRHTGAEKGSLMVLNDRDELCILSARGVEERFLRNYKIRIGEGIAGTVAAEGEPVLVTNVDTDERFRRAKRDRYKTRSFISCPLKDKASVLGVLNINDKKDGSPFTGDEFVLIQIIANQAALALKNAFLLRQLKAQASELEEVNRKLIDSDVSKTEFLTRISHELRTPLNAIKGAAYYLTCAPLAATEERTEFLRIINDEADKLIGFSERQLDFLRLQDESRVMDNRILRLEKVLKEALDSHLLQSCLSERNVQVRTDIPKGLPDLVGDRILLGQLFINLLEGFCLHLDAGAVITLSARETEALEVDFELSRPLPKSVVQCFYTSAREISDRLGDCVKIYLALKNAEAHGWRHAAEEREEGFRLTFIIPRRDRQRIEAAVDATMDMLVDFTSELLGVNSCSLMLADEVTGDLAIRSARGLDEEIVRRTRIRIGDRIAGWVAQEGKPLLVEDIETDPRFGRRNLDRQYASNSLMALPLRSGDRVIGVINFNNRKDGRSFTPRDLRIARVFSERIAAFIENLTRDSSSEKDLATLVTSLNGLSNAERSYHKKDFRLADLVDQTLERLGMAEEERDLGLYAAMIYDLGLVSVEKSITGKKGKLTPSERNTLKSHPFTTVDLLGDVEFSEKVRRIVLHHHEKYDGTGYPDRLKGDDIPLISRVLAVVDAYCAMTEERPYRQGMSREEAMEEIRKESGRAFDSDIVKHFSGIVAADPTSG